MAAELIAKVYSVGLLVIGVSHLLHPKLWSEFFAAVLRTRYAALLIGMFTLPQALLIVVGHNVWSGPATLITIAGWGMLVKSTLYLLRPRIAERLVAIGATASRSYSVVGAVMAALGLLLVHDSFPVLQQFTMMAEAPAGLLLHGGLVKVDADPRVDGDVRKGISRSQRLLEAGNLPGAEEAALAALRSARRAGEEQGIAQAGLATGVVYVTRGRYADARKLLADAVRAFTRGGDALRQVQAHYLLGEIAYVAEDPIRAGSHYRDALAVARGAAMQEWIDLLTLKFEHR